MNSVVLVKINGELSVTSVIKSHKKKSIDNPKYQFFHHILLEKYNNNIHYVFFEEKLEIKRYFVWLKEVDSCLHHIDPMLFSTWPIPKQSPSL